LAVLRFYALVTASFFLVSCTDRKDQPPYLVELNGNALGTTWVVKVLPHKSIDSEDLKKSIAHRLAHYEKIFSHWRKDSDLSKFNSNKSIEPVEIHPEIHELLKHAQWMHQQTAGTFDPAIGQIVNLWGFGPDGRNRSTIPKDEEVIEALHSSGMHQLEILPKHHVCKKHQDLKLDLSGSAKGEIIDQICELLERYGLHNYLVEIGGEIRAHGRGKKGKGWIVGLENGGKGKDQLVSIPLRNYAVATSGTYRLQKPNPKAKKNASHLLNPKTGKPVDNNLIAVNAFAPTARDADAWATALMIMGLEKGMQKAEEMDLVARFCELKDGITNIYCSTAYHRLYPTEKNF
jgi:thiamine biosynthesis lipoprotein